MNLNLIFSLLLAASNASGLPIPKNVVLPKVTTANHFYEHKISKNSEISAAITDPLTGNIVLHLGWSADDSQDVCLLEHELVHFLQFKNNQFRNDPPASLVEPLAYHVQAMCLASYGLDDSADWLDARAEEFKQGKYDSNR